jgi:hypothetical protein
MPALNGFRRANSLRSASVVNQKLIRDFGPNPLQGFDKSIRFARPALNRGWASCILARCDGAKQVRGQFLCKGRAVSPQVAARSSMHLHQFMSDDLEIYLTGKGYPVCYSVNRARKL